MHDLLPLLQSGDFPPIVRGPLETVQANLGYRCNQACLHCHVNAGPQRNESMDPDTIEQVLGFLKHSGVSTLDLTGGAPELNPRFRYLVEAAADLHLKIIDRCNLTILEEPGQEDLAGFLAARRVEIVASLPCYLEENVDRQRGHGVFEASLRALARLNALGYGQSGSGLALHLVYNPQGPTLPPDQAELEAAYRHELKRRYGIVFDRLYALANLPIQRFGSTLVSKGQFDPYLRLLKGAHRPENLPDVMCRGLVSIDWRGFVHDCDFNQMLGLPLGGRRRHLTEIDAAALAGQAVATADHCYGCTAGQGSSCGGALHPTL